jgi:hypothetical protein
VYLPEELVEAARVQGTRRVEGTMNDEPVNLGVNRSDITVQAFVYAGKSLQRRLGVRPGEVVDCRLRPADPNEVHVPSDVADALTNADRKDAFDRLRPGQRRRLLAVIEGAGSKPTRSSRIQDLLSSLEPS